MGDRGRVRDRRDDGDVPDHVAGTGEASAWPTSARVAAVLLAVVGVANAAVGVLGLTVVPAEVTTALAAGLLVAGLATLVVARLVWRRGRVALYVALVVFELLLIAQLVGLDDATAAELVASGVLVVLVVSLWVAAIQVRRRHRRVHR